MSPAGLTGAPDRRPSSDDGRGRRDRPMIRTQLDFLIVSSSRPTTWEGSIIEPVLPVITDVGRRDGEPSAQTMATSSL